MTVTASAPAQTSTRAPWYSILYVQVLIAIALGVLVGHFYPGTGKALKPLGDGFIALIKMMIAPVIFCTVVHGISSMGDLKRVGRVGIKTLFYFEVVSTVALLIGLLVGELIQPGSGFNIDPATLDPKAVATYVTKAKRRRHCRAPDGDYSGELFRRARKGRSFAGVAGVDSVRFRHRLHGTSG